MSWASAGLLDCLPSSGWFSKGSFLITSMPSPPPVSFLEASATEYSCATWYCNGWGQRRRELVMGWLWMGMDGCMSSSGLSHRMGHKINRPQQSSSSSYNRLNQLASAGEIRGGREGSGTGWQIGSRFQCPNGRIVKLRGGHKTCRPIR